jgi:NDP-sugar pyrophosphorylase family protein
MKTVIMAGGKGTRISSLAADIPKPMIKIKGKPILEYQIESLSKQGSDEFIFIIGHLGNIIEEYFGNGSKWNVCIEYIQEKYPLGTAGALYYLKDKIKEDFLLINGDIIFDVDINRFYKYHMEKKGWATILTHPNSHPYDSGLIITDNNNKVIQWVHKEQSRINYKNRVNAGIHLLSPNVFELFNEEKKVDLDREILQAMISEELLYAYDSPEYVKDMGTPDRYKRSARI